MSIKFRLVLSYFAMLIVPIILTFMAAGIIFVFQMGSISHGMKGFSGDFLKELSQRSVGIISELNDLTDKNPDQLKNQSYLEEAEKSLNTARMGVAVKKDGQYIFKSNYLNDKVLLAKIENFKSRGSQYSNVILNVMNNRTYMVTKRDFTFSDKSAGSLYILVDVSVVSDFTTRFFSTLAISVLIILILTNGIITWLVSRSIIKPLKLLKMGAEQIQQGNLNFAVRSKSRDEIGEVCNAFEQMRYRLKKSVEMQLQYDDNRKELITSISHDLKTPITSIKGYVEGILDGVADSPEKMDRYIRTIYAKAADMDRLIDDLFLFSKLDVKKLPFTFEEVDVIKYFEDSIEELRMDIEDKNIELAMENHLQGQVFVVADREKLKRVIVNIIQNAVKYMDKEKGCIGVKLENRENMVSVSIRDNGQGIEPVDLPNIFERFYRSDSSRNSSTGGSGLGLAIVKQIVEGHGGTIWAESEVGKGTMINFTLKKRGSGNDEKDFDH